MPHLSAAQILASACVVSLLSQRVISQRKHPTGAGAAIMLANITLMRICQLTANSFCQVSPQI
jgi:hypothetical protein